MTKFVVEGNDLDGATVARNVPVLVGGVAANNTVQTLKVGTDGSLAVTTGATGGALTPAAPGTGTVGTSSAQLLAANASRTGLTITNLSTANVYLGLGATAVLSSGITLVPAVTWEMDSFTFVNGVINAIGVSGSQTVAYQEFS